MQKPSKNFKIRHSFNNIEKICPTYAKYGYCSENHYQQHKDCITYSRTQFCMQQLMRACPYFHRKMCLEWKRQGDCTNVNCQNLHKNCESYQKYQICRKNDCPFFHEKPKQIVFIRKNSNNHPKKTKKIKSEKTLNNFNIIDPHFSPTEQSIRKEIVIPEPEEQKSENIEPPQLPIKDEEKIENFDTVQPPFLLQNEPPPPNIIQPPIQPVNPIPNNTLVVNQPQLELIHLRVLNNTQLNSNNNFENPLLERISRFSANLRSIRLRLQTQSANMNLLSSLIDNSERNDLLERQERVIGNLDNLIETFIFLNNLALPLRNEGLSDVEFDRLPILLYGIEETFDKNLLDLDQASTFQTCAICLEEFQNSEILRKLNCKHQFHELCLKDWTKKKSNCPVCKQKILLQR